MKCPICQTKVLNNSDYSVHMNKLHRGNAYGTISEYEDLNNAGGNKKPCRKKQCKDKKCGFYHGKTD